MGFSPAKYGIWYLVYLWTGKTKLPAKYFFAALWHLKKKKKNDSLDTQSTDSIVSSFVDSSA